MMQFNNIYYYKKNTFNNIHKVNIPINIPKIENDKINNIPKIENNNIAKIKNNNIVKSENDNIPKSEIIVKPNIISNTTNITCKEEFRVFCSEYTCYIQNIELPEIKKNNNNEAVLIEFRILPHLEFLIRNTIIKLGPNWSHTIVCGNLNYNYLVKLCSTISENINVIKLDYNNLNQSTYSLLLSTSMFWNLFYGNKILIYQEDSIIFKSNIDEFIMWDYIGAPWPKTQNDTINSVGNGGLSLRSKDIMLKVIDKLNINNINLNSSTINYMKNVNLIICPEDVYFSKTMQDYNIGTVANWNSAYKFSTESILNSNSFGGHNFWLYDVNWKQRIYNNNIIQFNIPNKIVEGFNEHRGGWDTIKKSLDKNKLFSNNSKYNFYDMLDLLFLFNEGHYIENKWCGIFHCTPITPPYLNFININLIFKNINFIKSLKNCKGIITLSPYLTNYFNKKFKKNKIKINVFTLIHPTVTEDIIDFNYINFKYNNNKKIIQIGQQLRKLSSIYLLPDINNYSKLWLTGTKQFDKLKKFINEEIKMFNINENVIDYNKIPLTYLTNYNDYDILLSENIVFIELYDAAANNTVVECIVRNTPILVNKIPAIVDYLGNNYPLYYNNINEIPKLLTEENIFNAHQYLLNMNKENLYISYFNKKLFTLLYKLFNN